MNKKNFLIKSIILILFLVKYRLCIRCTVGEISKIERIEIPTVSKSLVRRACPKDVSNCINGTLYLKKHKIVVWRFDCDNHDECNKYKGNVCVPITDDFSMEGKICCCSNNENCNTLDIP